jgi:hypothetical protein
MIEKKGLTLKVIKNCFFVTDDEDQKSRVASPGKTFQPALILVGKARGGIHKTSSDKLAIIFTVAQRHSA